MARHLAKCPKCGSRLEYDSALGDRMRCPHCQATLSIPGKAKSQPSAEAPTQTAPEGATDPLIGTKLGDFQILELLGRGGMGSVYKAVETTLDRLVAIKVLPQRLAADASFIERFTREAKSAAAVEHPHIIEVHHVGTDRGHRYIAMEFIEGDNLHDVLRREGRLSPARALELFKQVTEALAEAHACGILHRDIKPSNILLDARGRAKVADFGLAKRPDTDVSVTATGQALGTPLYMPPEAARGEGFDGRSDLYSLGATFYHLLAGEPPFTGATGPELMFKHAEARVPPLQQAVPDAPVPLCRIIHRLLRKNPAERYESAEKLLEALNRVGPVGGVSVPRVPVGARAAAPTDTLPSAPRPVGGVSSPRVRPPRPRKRPLALLLGLPAAALVLVVVLVLVLGRGTRPKTSVPPSTRTPSTAHRPPPPSSAKDERNAEIVFNNIRTCTTHKDWPKAKTYLDRLTTKYRATNFVAAHEADIASLRHQIDAALKPAPPKPGTPKPGTATPQPAEPPERPIYAGPWIKHPEPVLSAGPPDSWDSRVVATPSVLKVGDEYRMYYAGNGARGERYGIGVAVSQDLLHWTNSPANPLLIPDPSERGLTTSAQPDVIRDGGVFRMYYCVAGRCIAYAESRDGIRWQKPDLKQFPHLEGPEFANACLACGRPGEWDQLAIESARVLKAGSVYHLYYTGIRRGLVKRIGHATSEDGIHWVKDAANPVLRPGKAGDWDGGSVHHPEVVREQDRFVMFFCGHAEGRTSQWRIGLATSRDGSRWRKWPQNPVLVPDPGRRWERAVVYSPSLLQDERGSHLFYTAVGHPQEGEGNVFHVGVARLGDARPPEAKAVPWTVYTQWPFDAAEAKRRQAETAKALGVPVEQEIDLGNDVKMTLVLIPAGEFLMGSPPTTSPEQLQKVFGDKVEVYEREFPQHRVTLAKPFWLGKTEVTHKQWQAVMGENPSHFKGNPQNPVEQVSWEDCQGFLQKLSAKCGRRSRLPTEAEWEYACRAGSPSEFYFGDSHRALAHHAWFSGNSPGTTQAVGQRKPSTWGLHDMAGNVFEWCQDWYAPYEKAARVDPEGPGAGGARVLRGGSWRRSPGHCRPAFRLMDHPADRPFHYGCRVCVVAGPAKTRRAQPTPRPDPRAEGPAGAEVEPRFQAALEPAEARERGWDFAGAAAELAKLKFEEKELAERVARRREEVERLTKLKAKMIARIRTAKPSLQRRSLLIPGINAELVSADEKGITAKRADGKSEVHEWKSLSARSVQRLVQYTIKKDDADDQLAAGLLLLECSRHAPRDGVPHAAREDYTAVIQAAERHFGEARKLGARIEPYLGPLAAAAFERAKGLLEEGRGARRPRLQEGRGARRPRLQEGRGARRPRLQEEKIREAEAALAKLAEAYGKTPWFAVHKAEVEAARAQARGGIAEAEAERLYAQAAALFKKQDLWALKPLVEKLKTDYAKTALVADAERKPSFAEMADAIAKLGKVLTVRQDGKGDFTSIQAAIDAAPPNSLIEVQDSGTYKESVRIGMGKDGMVLRGGRGCWPVITSVGARSNISRLLSVTASRVTLEQLVLAHVGAVGPVRCSLITGDGPTRLRSLIVYAEDEGTASLAAGGECHVENCLVIGRRGSGTEMWCHCVARNCLFLTRHVHAKNPCDLRHCIVPRLVMLIRGGALTDSVVGTVQAHSDKARIDYCNVTAGGKGYVDSARPGKGCFSADPQFRDPKNLDYRLKPTSPCRGKASDGGDIGCRFTPEMLEMLKVARELRRKGIIKF